MVHVGVHVRIVQFLCATVAILVGMIHNAKIIDVELHVIVRAARLLAVVYRQLHVLPVIYYKVICTSTVWYVIPSIMSSLSNKMLIQNVLDTGHFHV